MINLLVTRVAADMDIKEAETLNMLLQTATIDNLDTFTQSRLHELETTFRQWLDNHIGSVKTTIELSASRVKLSMPINHASAVTTLLQITNFDSYDPETESTLRNMETAFQLYIDQHKDA